MPHVTHVDEVEGVHFEAPYTRTIKHLHTPWDHEAQFLWLGMSEVPAGSQSNAHDHPTQEEAFFVYEGSGFVVVNGEEIPVRRGSVVVIAAGETHQLRASVNEAMRVYNCVAPPFKIEQFERVHDPIATT